MDRSLGRRPFLTGATAVFASSLTSELRGESEPGEVTLAIVGAGGRGTHLATTFAKLPGVRVKSIYDVDLQRAQQAAQRVTSQQEVPVDAAADFRVALDDPHIHAMVIATCNHWHAPAAVLAAQAGKHAYIEKPCSHNPHEGELLVAAAERFQVQLQHGTQRRSRPAIQQGIQRLRQGVLGRPYYAHCYYRNVRPTIGRGREAMPPAGLDYDLWQGPAPRKSFRSNYLHYDWHWFWHWGNGELGNNGVHFLDIARLALGVDFPKQVVSTGGRYHWPDDDQETPDTQIASFQFEGGKSISWEALSCNRNRPCPLGDEVWIYGTEGSCVFTDAGYRIYDGRGEQREQHDAEGGDTAHLQNFVDAIRGKQPLHAPIEEGHRSALLCHLGNIAYRLGRSLTCRSADGHILGDAEAMTHWKRAYEPGWEPTLS